MRRSNRLTRLLPSLEDNPLAYQQVRTLVGELVRDDAPEALAAFRNLSLLPSGERSLSGVNDVRDWVRRQEGAQPADVLLAVEIELEGLSEKERGVVVSELVTEFQAEHPRELARWLLRVGEGKTA